MNFASYFNIINKNQMKKLIKIEGMMCEGCANSVQEIISGINNVQYIHVNLAEGTAEVHSDKEISIEEMQRAIEENDKNYEVQEI